MNPPHSTGMPALQPAESPGPGKLPTPVLAVCGDMKLLYTVKPNTKGRPWAKAPRSWFQESWSMRSYFSGWCFKAPL